MPSPFPGMDPYLEDPRFWPVLHQAIITFIMGDLNACMPPGFDAQANEYKDMFQAGIIDPTKVVRTALQDAASVAGLVLTSEAMVAEIPEKKPAPAMPSGNGMDF